MNSKSGRFIIFKAYRTNFSCGKTVGFQEDIAVGQKLVKNSIWSKFTKLMVLSPSAPHGEWYKNRYLVNLTLCVEGGGRAAGPGWCSHRYMTTVVIYDYTTIV